MVAVFLSLLSSHSSSASLSASSESLLLGNPNFHSDSEIGCIDTTFVIEFLASTTPVCSEQFFLLRSACFYPLQ